MIRRVRCCGDTREDSGYAYCEVFECSCCEHLEHQMYGVNSFIPRDCGFIMKGISNVCSKGQGRCVVVL